MHRRLSQLSRAQKIVLSVAAVGTAAALAGAGTWATFTSAANADQSVSTGTVVIELGAPGTAANRLTVNATAVAPGDTIQRAVNLSNTGSLALGSLSLSTAATTSSILDTDTTDGLQMAIDRCSVAWTESGTAPAYNYACSGTTTSVVASRPVIGANLAMSNLTVTAPGTTDHLRVTVSLPSAAGNSFQGKSSTISYTFTATQRAGTSR
jgi:predicted ribosomally synthesized peptide with SipW-like signal peptide